MIIEKNFLDIYPYWKWEGSTIPRFVVGEKIEPVEMYMEEGKTTAPKLLTETDLISLMDNNGIGTDATIAEHISKIQERKYAVLERGEFKPTTLGEALVAGKLIRYYYKFNSSIVVVIKFSIDIFRIKLSFTNLSRL
jgi:DNA topoisomerase-3